MSDKFAQLRLNVDFGSDVAKQNLAGYAEKEARETRCLRLSEVPT